MVHRNGFTFIEILIVLFIISLSLFILTPKLTKGIVERQDVTLSQINGLLAEAVKQARSSREPAEITFILGSSNVIFNDQRVQLQDGLILQEADVNEYPAQSLEVAIRAYPDGICDYFTLKFSDGKVIKSIPLLCKVRLG
ncbi:MAG TPA: prepilin-type N-terminal cleavage/methylation domain-containing protein [Nitrospirae bacterium]|nr:prepilin-type N-terminal cleavage/methylation domain-containing protein [Nitrospirota bacterium]